MVKIEKLVVGKFQTNCYFYLSKDECVIIDPGGDFENIVKTWEKLKKPKVKFIINTHGHFDHIKENDNLRKFFKTKVAIHEKDAIFLKRPDLNLSEWINKKLILEDPDIYLKDGDIIKVGEKNLKIIETPGHTPGSICIFDGEIMFVGDLIFKDGIGRTDLPMGNKDEIFKSINKILNYNPNVFFPGHFEEFHKIDF